MTARLFCKTGKTQGLEIEIEGGREAIIGRDPANDLVIERPLMSSRHARISYDQDAGRYLLEDLDSLNGTELDGDRVSGSERLGHLHVITFAGSYDFFFVDAERAARRHPEPVEPPAAEERPAPAVAARPAVAAPAPEGTDEVTSVESEPVALPGFLARHADALGEPEAGASQVPSEITSIEREPIGLPAFLAQRADEAGAGATAEESPAEEPTAEEPPAEEPPIEEPPAEAPPAATEKAAADQPEKTLHEKLPVALPGVLAQRAEDAARVQKHETVDLAQIEDLITAEESALRQAREEKPTEGLQLIVTESGGRVWQYPVAEGENLIGRGGAAQVALKYPDLSRRHALLTVAGETITIRDLGSRNRTFVDDQAIEPEVDVGVEPGARLRFGSVEARLARV